MNSTDITASVTVSEMCGIQVDTTAITFTKDGDPLVPGDTSNNVVTRTVNNTGNLDMEFCKYQISGTEWSTNGFTMASTQTDYKCETGTGIDCMKTSWTPLPGSAETYLGLDAGTIANTDFQVTIPASQQSGTYGQTITITLI